MASRFERDPEELERLSGVTILFLEFLDLGNLVVEHGVEDVLDHGRSAVGERVGDEELDVGDRSRRSRAGNVEVGHFESGSCREYLTRMQVEYNKKNSSIFIFAKIYGSILRSWLGKWC